MKLKIFLIISAVVAGIYAVINPFLSNDPSTMAIWSVMVAIGAFFPALIAFVAQREKLKIFLTDYLLFRQTDRRNSAIYVGTTVVLYPLIVIMVIGILGNWLELDAFGALSTHFSINLFGLIHITSSSVFDVELAVLLQMVFLLIAGTVIGICNCIFEEIAWRGFMLKYLKCSDWAKGVVTGLIWSLWWLAMTYASGNFTNIALITVENVILSYYLVCIARNTGSVWTCAVIRGIFSLAAISADFYIPPTAIASITTKSIAVVIFVLITMRIKPGKAQ